MRYPASPKAATIRAAKASGSPRAVALIVLAMIRSTAAASALDVWSLSSLPWCQHQPHLSGCQARGLAAFGKAPHLRVMMLDLSDQETDALAGLLRRTIDETATRYPLAFRS